MNTADLLIVATIIAFGVSGFFKGFLRQLWDLVSLVLAFIISVKFYIGFSVYVAEKISVSGNISKVISFLIIWAAIQLVLNLVFYFLYPRIPEAIRKSFYNKVMGAVPGVLWGLVFVGIILSLFVAFPFNPKYKSEVQNSQISSFIVGKTSKIEGYFSNIFGGALNDTLTFLTVKPNSGETLDLGFKTTKVTVDEESEIKMLELLNKERTSRGLKALVMDEKLRDLAREHSRDMFARGYFSHNNPDGKDPFERMDDFGIVYLVAGENLALAPSVDLAHDGLMNSPGHRANILTAEFGKIGIGCIDGGVYGKMFSQEFTN